MEEEGVAWLAWAYSTVIKRVTDCWAVVPVAKDRKVENWEEDLSAAATGAGVR